MQPARVLGEGAGEGGPHACSLQPWSVLQEDIPSAGPTGTFALQPRAGPWGYHRNPPRLERAVSDPGRPCLVSGQPEATGSLA